MNSVQSANIQLIGNRQWILGDLDLSILQQVADDFALPKNREGEFVNRGLCELRLRIKKTKAESDYEEGKDNQDCPYPRLEGEPDALPPHNLLQFVPVIAEYGCLGLKQLLQGLFVTTKMLFVIFLERFLLRLDRLDVFTIKYGLESELL